MKKTAATGLSGRETDMSGHLYSKAVLKVCQDYTALSALRKVVMPTGESRRKFS